MKMSKDNLLEILRNNGDLNDVNCADRSGGYTARELKLMSEINALKISLELANNQIKDLWIQEQKSVDLKRVVKQLYDITQTNHYGDASIAYAEMKEIVVKCMEEIKNKEMI